MDENTSVFRVAFARGGKLNDTYFFECKSDNAVEISYGCRGGDFDDLTKSYLLDVEQIVTLMIEEDEYDCLMSLVDSILEKCQERNFRGTICEDGHDVFFLEGYEYYFNVKGKKFGFHEIESDEDKFKPLMCLFVELERISTIPVELYKHPSGKGVIPWKKRWESNPYTEY